jgi:hypothetical protein
MPAGPCLADRHARPFSSGTILAGLLENVFHFHFRDPVRMDVWHSSSRIDVEADLHDLKANTVTGWSTSTNQ